MATRAKAFANAVYGREIDAVSVGYITGRC